MIEIGGDLVSCEGLDHVEHNAIRSAFLYLSNRNAMHNLKVNFAGRNFEGSVTHSTLDGKWNEVSYSAYQHSVRL